MRTILLALFFISIGVQAQTVKNITTQQVGDKIQINYNIENSSTDQSFKVSVSCLVNGTNKMVLKSVTGDVGVGIAGGKAQYKVTWDVLQDVEELSSAEFFVKIELEKTKNIAAKASGSLHPWNVSYYGGLSYTPFGLRIAYEKNWGYFAAMRFGSGFYDFGTGIEDATLVSMTVGVSKNLYTKNDFKLKGFLGVGYGLWGYYTTTIPDPLNNSQDYIASGDDDEGAEIDFGLSFEKNRFVGTLGFAIISGDFDTNGDFLLGLGYTF